MVVVGLLVVFIHPLMTLRAPTRITWVKRAAFGVREEGLEETRVAAAVVRPGLIHKDDEPPLDAG